MGHNRDGDAALIAALDLVVAPDTTVAPLAGSIGCPVWCLTVAQGTWLLLGTAGSPWFPKRRLVRQQQRGCWESLCSRLATALARRAGRREVVTNPRQ